MSQSTVPKTDFWIDFLLSAGLSVESDKIEEYAKKFKKNHITQELAVGLTLEDLTSLGITDPEHQMLILNETRLMGRVLRPPKQYEEILPAAAPVYPVNEVTAAPNEMELLQMEYRRQRNMLKRELKDYRRWYRRQKKKEERQQQAAAQYNMPSTAAAAYGYPAWGAPSHAYGYYPYHAAQQHPVAHHSAYPYGYPASASYYPF